MSWLKTPAQQQERIRKYREKQEQERSQSSNDKLDSTHEDLDPPPHLPNPSSSLPPDVAMADDMSPDAKTIVLSLREELAAMRQSQAEIKHLLGLATAPPPAPAPAPARDPSPPRKSLREDMRQKFLCTPMKTWEQMNTRPAILVYLGDNFADWKACVDRTLRHAFCLTESWFKADDNFETLKPEEKSSVAALLRNTVAEPLFKLIEHMDEPATIWKFLSARCSHTDRHRKLTVVDQVVALINQSSPSDDFTLSKWSAAKSEVDQMKVTIDELFGLLLQGYFKPPPGVNTQTYGFSVDQQLNGKKVVPTFEEVTTIVQYATGNLMTKTSASTVNPVADPMAMDLDKIQAMYSNRPYVAPHRRNNNNDEKPKKSFSVEKASYYRGRGQSDALTAKYGDKCAYCKVKGHWYSDCVDFWRDVATKQIPAPPENHTAKDSTYAPPCRPDNRFRKVDFPQVSEGVLLDSGASAHVSGNSSLFTVDRELTTPRTFYLAVSDCHVLVSKIGSVRIPTPTGTIRIEGVYLCDGVDGIILSTGRLVSEGWKLVYKGVEATLIDPCNNQFKTIFHNYCWLLQTSQLQSKKVTQLPSFDSYLWHVRLGHVSDEVVKKYLRVNYPENKAPWKEFFCEQCAVSKSLDKKSLGVETRILREKPMDLFVSDVMGPLPLDLSGCAYMLTLRDHFSTYTWCAPIAARADVPEKICQWLAHLKARLGRYPSYIRCDNAPEYIHTLRSRLKPLGVILAPVPPYSPKQNGEAERVNRTLGDMARTMLHGSQLSKMFWSHAYLTACHLHNRTPNSRTGDKSPLELMYEVSSNPNTLYPFGAKAIVHIPKERRAKLDERAQDGRLIGYPAAGAGWMFWLPKEKRIVNSASATFPDFQHLPVAKEVKKTDIDFILNQITLRLGQEETAEICAEEERQLLLLMIGPEHDLPKNIKQALAGPDAEEWRGAAKYEMKKFEELDVWVAVSPTAGIKALGGRWVFSIKRKVDGTIDKFRARYVAKGFNQRLGIDCNETYAPTASLNTLRLMISMSKVFNLPTATFDVSSAYLYSPIEEDVYVQAPVEIFPELKGKVMKLKKALYGTKQAARCWWKFFKKTVESLGFEASEVESSLYLFKRDGGFVMIWLHVDNGFAMASSQDLLDELRRGMEAQLEIKWSDKVERLVGMDFKENEGKLVVSQGVLAQQIVDKYTRQTYNHDSLLPEEDLVISTSEPVEQTEFRSVIARFSSNPSETHWKALDWLVGYLKKSVAKGLVFGGTGKGIELWTDANWGGEHERSTTGYLLTHCGDSIAWGSKRQTVVALSTCAAEYLAISEGAQQLAHLINILDDVKYRPHLSMKCDNEAAILIVSDNASKKKTKYLQRAFYFANDLIRENNIELQWTSTHNQLADIFTKRLGPTKMTSATAKLGLTG
ncbi:hypothetical protein MJO28_011684 [Puccinia striiformis f. sp. tritici]|uniref:Uncharacterized protein n=1 Tax=Puccinia striiformis f. sp. tritici TaxID=168172 RepID=A0ACC0E3D9_9BASI|nr:hypothetical protein MJO28_011684 [Puccinia striiformis f. sp. tritici]